jgi:hypothetical protein
MAADVWFAAEYISVAGMIVSDAVKLYMFGFPYPTGHQSATLDAPISHVTWFAPAARCTSKTRMAALGVAMATREPVECTRSSAVTFQFPEIVNAAFLADTAYT